VDALQPNGRSQTGLKKYPNGWKNGQRIKAADRKMIGSKSVARKTMLNYLATIILLNN
jgi:hypothetical protein